MAGMRVMPEACDALPGRTTEMPVVANHAVLGCPLTPPYPTGTLTLLFGMGCFWGAERLFWQQPGVYVTAVGYAGGYTPNPNYEEVCSGMTGHAEVVQVVFDPCQLDSMLATFWEQHDPTQGMRQGNDIGTQYRSAIYCPDERVLSRVLESRDDYQLALIENGHAEIKTEIALSKPFYYAESYHQQYLSKNPNGYCGLAGTGVAFTAAS